MDDVVTITMRHDRCSIGFIMFVRINEAFLERILQGVQPLSKSMIGLISQSLWP